MKKNDYKWWNDPVVLPLDIKNTRLMGWAIGSKFIIMFYYILAFTGLIDFAPDENKISYVAGYGLLGLIYFTLWIWWGIRQYRINKLIKKREQEYWEMNNPSPIKLLPQYAESLRTSNEQP